MENIPPKWKPKWQNSASFYKVFKQNLEFKENYTLKRQNQQLDNHFIGFEIRPSSARTYLDSR